MKKALYIALATLSGTLFAQSVPVSVGIVNLKECVEASKLGKSEQAAFESLKDQMMAILEKTEKELDDIAKKLSDQEYMDSLSQEAETELKNRFQALSQELARYQNQYYQILNQANFKLVQELTTKVGDAAAAVAKTKNVSLVVNEDATFYFDPSFEITKDVVVELDKRFDAEEAAKKEAEAQKQEEKK